MIYVVIAVLIVIAFAIVYLILSAPRRESQRPGMEKLLGAGGFERAVLMKKIGEAPEIVEVI